MSLEGKRPQMPGKPGPLREGTGEAWRAPQGEEAPSAVHETERSGASDLMVKVLERRNLQAALARVKKNKGSAGIDGMTVDELPPPACAKTGHGCASNCSRGRTSRRK